MFEMSSKNIIGLERLMLEASGFDFRNRYPQKSLLKIARYYNVDRETIGKTAYNMSLDLYRTFAPLKQTTSTMAIACVELSARIFELHIDELEAGKNYKKWKTTRTEVMGSYWVSPYHTPQSPIPHTRSNKHQKPSSISSTSTPTTAAPQSSAKSTP